MEGEQIVELGREPGANGPRCTIGVARTVEDMMQAVAIRAAVYMAEQRCPYDEEFDGNDFAATHVVARVDGEPAGTVRIRYFGDFVKCERFAIRREFRKLGLGMLMHNHSVAFCRRKGFRLMLVHAQKRLLPYWTRVGFRPAGDVFHFSDHEYVTMLLDLAEAPDRLGTLTDHDVLNRPEGEWDWPGVLERSKLRPPTNPADLP